MRCSSLKSGILVVWVCLFSFPCLTFSKIVWKTTTNEHRAKVDNESIHSVFEFEVVDQPITIVSIATSCGCTTAALEKKSYQPGETGTIKAVFELGGRQGQQEKRVEIRTDDPNKPVHELRIKVYIPQILVIKPRFLYWEKSADRFQEQIVELLADSEIPIEIVDIKSDTEQLKVRWEENEKGEYRVFLQPEIPQGIKPFFRSVVSIEIDSTEKLKQKTYYIYAFMKSY